MALINRRLMRRSAGIFRALDDQSEREVSLIDEGTVKDVRRHFGVIAGYWNRLSDAEGISWGVVDVIALGLAVFALVRATSTASEVGTIFATIACTWFCIGGFDQVPTVLQRMSNLADTWRRARRARGRRGSTCPDDAGFALVRLMPPAVRIPR